MANAISRAHACSGKTTKKADVVEYLGVFRHVGFFVLAPIAQPMTNVTQILSQIESGDAKLYTGFMIVPTIIKRNPLSCPAHAGASSTPRPPPSITGFPEH